ncbi:MAG: GIY-YIG nuclease family protein [Nitrospirae bacterium]|nr:GIY-YIG nuclease family protein [Nitrospirota bacterium]
MKKFNCKGVFYTYIVECQDGTYYTGYTNDLEKRLGEHNGSKRGARYTRGKRPVRLVWKKEYKYFKKAILEEIRIKKLTRKQKEELVKSGTPLREICKNSLDNFRHTQRDNSH